MEKRTSLQPFTVQDPRLSAVQIDLQEAETQARHIFRAVDTHYERSVLQLNARSVLADMAELTELLVRIQDKLSRVALPGDPDRLRRVVFNSLQAQS
jgi:capsular polysaccharide biosynthesis protein